MILRFDADEMSDLAYLARYCSAIPDLLKDSKLTWNVVADADTSAARETLSSLEAITRSPSLMECVCKESGLTSDRVEALVLKLKATE